MNKTSKKHDSQRLHEQLHVRPIVRGKARATLGRLRLNRGKVPMMRNSKLLLNNFNDGSAVLEVTVDGTGVPSVGRYNGLWRV
jgi:hypothetical protein